MRRTDRQLRSRGIAIPDDPWAWILLVTKNHAIEAVLGF